MTFILKNPSRKLPLNSNLDLLLDDLHNSLYKSKENAYKSITKKGFIITDILRNEILIRGNRIKTTKTLELDKY